MRKLSSLLLLLMALLLTTSNAQAQSYQFKLDKLDLHAFVNADGSVSMGYTFTFTNSANGHLIDYIDVGMPNGSFNTADIDAKVDNVPVNVSASDYQGTGTGFAVVLGGKAIQPGHTATVTVWVPHLDPWLQLDSSDSKYASIVVSPTWFGREYMLGATDMSVTIHLPPGIKPEEPRWHESPSGFPAQPQTGMDNQGRVTYTWSNTAASGWEPHLFGASFPAQYVPASAIKRPSLWETLGIDPADFMPFMFCGGILLLIFGSSYYSSRVQARRKLQYLPPRVAIEGMGIKRGLTAVEAAILLEQPLDKILTMILFGVLKKNAAEVVKQNPLQIKKTDSPDADLRDYELDFLNAFESPSVKEQRKQLQDMIIGLVKTVSAKMKGFSRKETVAYYKDITDRAWKQVEAANTPEVKSAKFDEVMEWTMLDHNYDGRTRDTFSHGPVYVPNWWWRYDPHVPRPVAAPTGGAFSASSAPSMPSGSRSSLPTLPGGAFAASMVNGVQNFAGNVIGNVNDFTSGVTNRTNPVPVAAANKSTWSGGGGSSGGHSSCACACACAGCACACAGGGR